MAARKSLSDLRTAVRDNLDESTASFWTNAELNRFINRAKDKVWVEVRKLKLDFFEKSLASTAGSQTILGETYDPTNLRVTVGGSTMTLPPDFHELKYLEVITSGHEDVVFRYLDLANPLFRRLRAMTDNTAPSEFRFDVYGTSYSNQILVYAPKSDTLLDTRLFYVYKPADLSADADELDMPDPLYIAVEEYATTRAQLKDRDELAAVWQQMGNKTVADLVGAAARQTQDIECAQSAFEDDL
ncbi:MAG TPA: hypothetical protein VD948_12570 [Rhodothermales bacterium]|nr:hypothetical protein [Rhodothermales bacterium]